MKRIVISSIIFCFTYITGCKNDIKDSYIENKTPIMKSDTVYFLGSSTIEYFDAQLQFWPQNYHLNTINLGKGGELIDSMCIRIGAIPVHAQFFKNEIKSNTKNYFKADWMTDHALKTFDAKIANIEGKIGIDSNGYYFETSDTTNVDINEKYKIYSLQKFVQNSVFIVNLGKNNLLNQSNGSVSYSYVFERSKQCTEWINKNTTSRILVIGHFSAVNSDENLLMNVNYLNQELSNYYADKFFDLNQYLSSKNIWQDINLQPQISDLDAQRINMLAPSLASDPIHLNKSTNKAIVNKIYEKIAEKNWVE